MVLIIDVDDVFIEKQNTDHLHVKTQRQVSHSQGWDGVTQRADNIVIKPADDIVIKPADKCNVIAAMQKQ